MDRWDVITAAGIALIGVGLGLLDPWLGLTAAGLALLALGVTGAIAAERPPAAEQDNERKGKR